MTQGSSARLEQAAHNRQVAGSNPAPATTFPRTLASFDAELHAAMHPECPVEVAIAPEECSPWNILAAALLLAFSGWMLFVLVLGAFKILQTYPAF